MTSGWHDLYTNGSTPSWPFKEAGMARSSDDAGPPATPKAGGRRDFMRRAAVVGTGAFVVPTIITVDPADAQALTSPPPEPPGKPESPPVSERVC